jgi:hypothetical protein
MKRLCVLVYSLIVLLLLFSSACGGGSGSTQPPPPTQVAILSTPPTQASEGSAYSYALQANVTAATFELTSGPSGAAVSGGTLTWTPTSQQVRTKNDFTITAKYSGTNATQSWSVTPTGYIRGTTADTCISDNGQTTSINTFGGATVSALVPATGGGFDTHSATVAPDGTFSIANVPAGSFWLTALNTNLWTDRSQINLGSSQWGGCKYEAPSSAGTSLQASVSELNPWQYYDYFYYTVPNARSSKGALPNVGDTSLSFTIPSGNLVLLNSANGDNGYYAQLVTAAYGGVEFHALQNFYGPQPVTVQDGTVNSLTATLQEVLQTSSVRANIRGSAFAALHDSMFPGAAMASPGDNFRIDISVDNVSPLSSGSFLVLASQAFSTDQDLGEVWFGNPYPATWTPFLDYYDFAIHNIQAPNATNSFPLPLSNRVVSAQLPTASSPISPLVGPPLNPQIDGKDLFQDQTINGTSPMFSWQPPAVGTATGYLIRPYEVVVNNGTPSLDFKGVFYVMGTSVQLPPGVLSSGKTYTFVIESVYRKTDVGANPNLETMPEGSADLGTGLITFQ